MTTATRRIYAAACKRPHRMNGPIVGLLAVALVALMLAAVMLAAGGCGPLAGLAAVDPDADPVAVSAERAIVGGWEAVNTFLAADDAVRDWARENVPAVHAAAEQLRRDAPAVRREALAALKLYKQTRRKADADDAQARARELGKLADRARVELATLRQRKPPPWPQ